MSLSRLLLILASLALLAACGTDRRLARPTQQAAATSSIHAFELPDIQGKATSLGEFKGKHLLIVNVASKCGYTPQYAELQALHEQYGDRVEVLGFPANNFMGQEPGSEEEIAAFCEKNYGVTFKMFSKISVEGDDQHPLYGWLSSPEQNGWNAQAPTWNFCKYLISPDGQLLKFYGSAISPLDPEILGVIDPQKSGPREAPPAGGAEML